MRNLEEVKKRFLQDDLSVRLGGIASNLARLKSFSQMPGGKEAVEDLIEESKFFIEWTAPLASLNVQEELVKIQVQLALLDKTVELDKIAQSADMWSSRVLELSGLLEGG